MSCLLARGHIDAQTLDITIPEQNLTKIDVPAFVDNMHSDILPISSLLLNLNEATL